MIYVFIVLFITYIVGSIGYVYLLKRTNDAYTKIVHKSLDQVKETTDQMNKLALAKSVYEYKQDSVESITDEEMKLPDILPEELMDSTMFDRMINKTNNPEEKEVIDG